MSFEYRITIYNLLQFVITILIIIHWFNMQDIVYSIHSEQQILFFPAKSIKISNKYYTTKNKNIIKLYTDSGEEKGEAKTAPNDQGGDQNISKILTCTTKNQLDNFYIIKHSKENVLVQRKTFQFSS
eukprot:TRINITY_DN15495_c0_g1_i2.p1 TRINITY_DN15495_c0_g1~~TRINITY_DN15495_c0_g1_i2.p1  ORF type:complete len:127 (+),score=0.17 TRINITY_DN15495_c0_g1_i2:290-670(+)